MKIKSLILKKSTGYSLHKKIDVYYDWVYFNPRSCSFYSLLPINYCWSLETVYLHTSLPIPLYVVIPSMETLDLSERTRLRTKP